jgi:protease-4
VILDIRQAAASVRQPFRWLVLAAIFLFLGLGVVSLVVFVADHPRGIVRVGLVLIAIGVVGTILLGLVSARVPKRTIVELDLTKPVAEKGSSSPLSKFGGGSKTLTIREVVEGLERAGRDKRVVGLFARVEFPAEGALADELRDAIAAFRAKGKFAVSFSYSMVYPGGYYVATAFDEIAVQPSGEVNVTGWLAQGFFLRGFLDKIGLQARLGQRYEYKNAVNQFNEKKFTPAHREAATRLAESRFEQLVEAVSSSRNMSPEAARGVLLRGPYPAHDALTEGLVDRLAYYDEIVDAVKERGGKGSKLLFLQKYAKKTKRGANRGQTIAFVHAVGGVVGGKGGGWSPLTQGPSMGADTVSSALRAAAKNKSVKAIVLRVSSPGGSAVASDTIWREVVNARAKGKPVIASMGNVAASGGYFISMPADRIVASAGTITGSIGVFGGKYVVSELQKKLGVSTDEVHEGDTATFQSASSDYSDPQWEVLQKSLDLIYDDFTEKAAQGRKMPLEQLRELARGRVWSGIDAKERGLVDDLGGLATALRVAREVAGLKPDARIKVKEFPKKKGAMARVGSGADASDADEASASVTSVGDVLAALNVKVPAAGAIAFYDVWRVVQGGALTMEPPPDLF